MVQTRPNGTNDSPVKLSFDDKLTGRGLNSDALQRKLKTLYEELSSITESEPENIDLTSFATVRKDLISTSVLLHKDKGVKAYAACCIAELLNVYAPDAPYTAPELKDIFQFFFRQLMTGLKGVDAPYYNLYHNLLASLSRTKSAVLVCDLPQADEILAEIFKDCFTLASLSLPATIEAYMADILAALLDECQTVPADVVDIIITQFNTKKSAATTPAFKLAVEVCNASSEKLVRHVCQYFTDTIVQHRADDPEDEEERDLETIRGAHNLVKRMHRYCPKLLMNVIPQLEEELRVDDLQIRTLATQTLGDMYAHLHGSDLVKQYRSTWVAWTSRKNDKSPVIRVAFVDAAKKLFSNGDMRADISEAMKVKVLDPDDKVRIAVCKIYGDLDFETATYHVTLEQLQAVGERVLDKKHTVRLEAFDCLGKLYSRASQEIEKGNPDVIAHFGWIPERLLHAAALSPEIKVVAEDIISRYVFPFQTGIKGEVDEEAWALRFLRVAANLSEKAMETLLSLSGIRTIRPSGYTVYVDCCGDFNGGIIDEDEELITKRMNNVSRQLSNHFPNPSKAEADLMAFAKHNDRRTFKHLKTCMDLQTDLKAMIKAHNDFLKLVEKDLPSAETTMRIFLRRCSLWLVNMSSIPIFLEKLRASTASRSATSKSKAKVNGVEDSPRVAEQAKRVLLYTVKNCPQLFYQHVTALSSEVQAKSNEDTLEVSLRALAAIARQDVSQAPSDSRLVEAMTKLALGSDRSHAKQAAKFLSNFKGKEKVSSSLVEKLSKLLVKARNDSDLAAHIAALGEFAFHTPNQFEEKSDVIVKFLLKDLLYRDIEEQDSMETDEDDDENQGEWCPDDQVNPVVAAKCETLKLLTKRCLAHATGEAILVAKPVVKLLFDVLDFDGSTKAYEGLEGESNRLKNPREGGPNNRSRLRLTAGCCLLKLGEVDNLSGLIQPRFPLLAIVVQDFCFQVRKTFIHKLVQKFFGNKLKPYFNVIPFLTCHDVEPEVKEVARQYVIVMTRRLSPAQKLQRFDAIFVRFLHLLAHHPDYDASEKDEGLPALAVYIDFFLELVATSENVALLYHLALQCKTVRDVEDDKVRDPEQKSFSEHLYLLSELADYAIKERAKNNGWTLSTYPGKVKLPEDILKPLPSSEALSKVRKTVYLTEEMIGWLHDIGKPGRPVPIKAKKRKSDGKSKRPTKRRKKNDSDDESQDDNESDSDDDTGTAEPPVPTSDEDMSEGDDSGTEKSSTQGRGGRRKAKTRAQKARKNKRLQ